MARFICSRKQLDSSTPLVPGTQSCVESLSNSESYRADDKLTPFFFINEEKNEELSEIK